MNKNLSDLTIDDLAQEISYLHAKAVKRSQELEEDTKYLKQLREEILSRLRGPNGEKP